MTYDKTVYYSDDDIKVFLEKIGEQMFVHVTIFNMTRGVLKKIREKWGEVALSLYYQGYESLFSYTKDSRIIKLIGEPEYVDSAKGYEVWKWDLS